MKIRKLRLEETPTQAKKKRLMLFARTKVDTLRWSSIAKAIRTTPMVMDDEFGRVMRVCIGSRTVLSASEKYYNERYDHRSGIEREADRIWLKNIGSEAKKRGYKLRIRITEHEPLIFIIRLVKGG